MYKDTNSHFLMYFVLSLYHLRYQHSRDLVTLLNFFSNSSADLPSGWEKKSDQFGQVKFQFIYLNFEFYIFLILSRRVVLDC